MHDDKEVALQIVPANEQVFKDDSYLIMIKYFDPETWSLGEPRELWISKKANIAELNKVVAAAFGLNESCTSLTKINSPWSFHRVILPF